MGSSRITVGMDLQDIVIALAEGNPGALAACMEILKESERIDDVMGWIGVLLALDTHRIYGSRIYMFWSDVCKRDVSKMLAVLRAYQLGQLAGVTEYKINHAIDNRGEGLDLEEIMAIVQERLPRFNSNKMPNN